MKGLFVLLILIAANLLSACGGGPSAPAAPAATEQDWWNVASHRPAATGAQTPRTWPELNWNQSPTSPSPEQASPQTGSPGVLSQNTTSPTQAGAKSSRLFYRQQAGTPMFVKNFSHTELDCSWMGVGGQVFAGDAWPVTGLQVELGGYLADRVISEKTLTGSAQKWGPGGYEFTLADRPIESVGTLWLQVYDQQGKPVSERIYFNTSADCFRNAVMVNLLEETYNEPYQFYLPGIYRELEPGK